MCQKIIAVMKQPKRLVAKLNRVEIKEQPELEDLTVIPSLEQQKFKSVIYGYNEVIVEGVTSNIDKDIKAENIKAGVNILGVDGNFKGIDTSDATATEEDIAEGKTAYVNGEKITGTLKDGGGSGSEYNAVMDTDVLKTNTSSSNNFILCKLLSEVPKINTTGWESTAYIYHSCTRLKEPPQIDTSNVKYMNYMFHSCEMMTKVPELNTSNVTNMSNMFYKCTSLENLQELDASKVNNVAYMFDNCNLLKNLGGFKNLGKAYTKQSNDYGNYRLNLSTCKKLTHESLMNVINNLYDLNLTYDVANGGTLYTQGLVLGSTNTAKLTAEEIAVATAKGWTVS